MKKDKNIQITDTIHNIISKLDSVEEYEFYHWCIEAVNNKVLSDFIYHPESFILSESKTAPVAIDTKKKKNKSITIFRPHVYTADFRLEFTDMGYNLMILNKVSLFKPYNLPIMPFNEHTLFVDVKGKFQQFDGARSFGINQKWVYDKHFVYIYKIIPETLFIETWVPVSVTRTMKTNKIKTKYAQLKRVAQFIDPQSDIDIPSVKIKSHLG